MNQRIELSLDDRGRILIPPEIETCLGLAPGMILLVEKRKEDEGGLCLSKYPDQPILLDKEGIWVVAGNRLFNNHQITNIVRKEREDRADKLLERHNK
jgi:bifunctional DNA-binding transcriptional regulator/antitoxin component of YhaV-PrlF toxin-antitoxin module